MSKRDLRIISLLPGATEWVCELGLQQQLVGVSHECDYPAPVKELPHVTRSRIDTDGSGAEIDAQVRQASETQMPLFQLDAQQVQRLQPDLILTQSLCNVCAVRQHDVQHCIESLAKPCRLLDLRATTMDEIVADAQTIIDATGNQPHSVDALQRWRQRIASATRASQPSPPRITLLEWLDPLFCSGHWTPQLLQWAGGVDPIGQAGQPSRVITPAQLAEAKLDVILVACCGMDRRRSDQELAAVRQQPWWSRAIGNAHVHVMDGNAYFNRPGPRLADALEIVKELLEENRP